jgi:hypothetical protein
MAGIDARRLDLDKVGLAELASPPERREMIYGQYDKEVIAMIEARPLAPVPGVRAVGRGVRGRQSLLAVLRQHWLLYVMLLPALVCLALFSFYPLWGIALAFVDYNPFGGLAGSPFVGLENFRTIFGGSNFWLILRNTLWMATGKIVAGQLAAIVFALMVYELGFKPELYLQFL